MNSRLEKRQAEMRERLNAGRENAVFRAHSVDKATLRRVSKPVCHPKVKSPYLFKVPEIGESPRKIEQVPVSQAVDVMPEINSGENNPVAVVDSLVPEMFMGREVQRCRHCHLNQFITVNGNCRKCRQSLAPDPIPDVQPVAIVAPAPKGPGKPTRAPIMGKSMDVGFAVKLVRLANGLSQRDLALKGGWPRSYISKLENNRCVPFFDSISRIAVALDATPFALITIAEAACAA